MQYDIQNFLSDVDRRIVSRGREYYAGGNIQKLVKTGAQFRGKVDGSEFAPYTVKISFSNDGAVEDCSCDCPYDLGDVCKHMVAVLFAIEHGDYITKTPTEKTKPAVSLDALVACASKEDLATLILDRTKTDTAFYNEVLSALGAPAQEQLAATKAMVTESIRRNNRRGYIDYHGCDCICASMDEALDKAARQSNPATALALARYILLTGMELASTADSSSGSLSCTIASAMDLIGKSAHALSAQPDTEKRKQLDELLKDAHSKVFNGWDGERYELLRQAACLADSNSASKLYSALDAFLATHANDSFGQYYLNEDKLTRYTILTYTDGKTAARVYLDNNLDVDDLRHIAVQEDIESGDFANAEKLCLERATSKQSNPYAGPDSWNRLLYEIYTQSGNHEKLLSQAKQLLMLGDLSYWNILKRLLTADGVWEREYLPLLAALKSSRPCYEYMRILAGEGETEKLMALVREHPEAVFEYGKQLAPQYAREVYPLCMTQIRNACAAATDRKKYKSVCALIQMLANFGGIFEGKMLINEFREAYPRRPAMLEELSKAEKIIAKR